MKKELVIKQVGKWHRIVISNLKTIAEATQCGRELQKAGVKEWCIYMEATHHQVKCFK